MNIKRQAKMAESVAKSIRAKERKEFKQDKARDQLYRVLRKAGKPLDEITRKDVTKKEYEIIIKYFEIVRGYTSEYSVIKIYPNLK